MTENTVTLKGLKIGNPKGFSLPYALQIGTVSVKFDRDSLFSDTIVIEKLFISAPEISYEQADGTNNLSVLNENISRYLSFHSENGNAKESGKTPKTESPSKKVVIRDFVLNGAKIDLSASLPFVGTALSGTVDLPDLHLRNIGTDKNPITVEQTVAYLLDLIFRNSAEALAKSSYAKALNLSKGTAETVKEQINLLKEKGKSLENTFKSIFNP